MQAHTPARLLFVLFTALALLLPDCPCHISTALGLSDPHHPEKSLEDISRPSGAPYFSSQDSPCAPGEGHWANSHEKYAEECEKIDEPKEYLPSDILSHSWTQSALVSSKTLPFKVLGRGPPLDSPLSAQRSSCDSLCVYRL